MAKDPSSQMYLETMFYCMPVRLGVFFVALCTFLTSVLYCLDKPGWEYTFRHFEGGYALASRVIVAVVEVTGVVAGLVGILGTWYVKVSYVRTYNYWQYLRLVCLVLIYFVDVPLLTNCEGWINSVEQMTKENGWNNLLYRTAIAGNCTSERTEFFVFSSIGLVTFMYVIWCTSRYAELMDRAPRHLLRVPKDLSSGAFYSHSMGERSYLNGTYGKQDQNPMQQGGVPPSQMPPGNMPFQGLPQQFRAAPVTV